MSTIGNRIRDIRERKGMTQDDLSKRAEISKGFLSDVENNKRNVGSQNLLKIANVLGASVDYLLKGEAVKNIETEPIVIPENLSKAAEELHLSYSEALELLRVDKSVVARRGDRFRKDLSVEDWKKLYQAIKGVFG